MAKRARREKRPEKGLDRPLAGKRGPGRPRSAVYREVINRSENYRGIFSRPGLWERLYPALKDATTADEIERAFAAVEMPDRHEFASLAPLILKVIRAPRFRRRSKPQINFFADSLAARGNVSPRRSKDICDKFRKLFLSDHSIVRYEYWVQCSCGYRGTSTGHACRKCGAPIVFDG